MDTAGILVIHIRPMDMPVRTSKAAMFPVTFHNFDESCAVSRCLALSKDPSLQLMRSAWSTEFRSYAVAKHVNSCTVISSELVHI